MPTRRRSFRARRILLTTPLVALGLLGLGLGLQTSTSAASSPCSLYASPSGSDSNTGSAATPFATVAKLAAALSPGETGCLAPGATFTGDVSLSQGGQAGAPIVITSTDPSNRATIKGRVATFPGGDWITFSSVNFDGVNANGLPSPTVGSTHVTFSSVDVTNEHTAICFDLINSSTWGVARSTTIDSSRIHDCGRLPATNNDHGIYVSGYSTTITNNFIYDNADRGVQLRGSQGGVIEHNVIDGNGEGVIFGDLTASNNEVAYNIVANSNVRWNAESWWGSTAVGTNNSFHDNCVWSSNPTASYDANGGVTIGVAGFTTSANLVANPLYVDAAAGNFSLRAGSPCANYGPQVAAPLGVVTSTQATTTGQTTTSATEPPAATTTTTTTTTAATTTAAATTPTTPTTAPTTTSATTTTSDTTPSAGRRPKPPKRLTATSVGDAKITATAPLNATLPRIDRSATSSALIATTGRWAAAADYHYIWLRCNKAGTSCGPIRRSDTRAYKPRASDRGSRLRVMIIAQNRAGSTSVTSLQSRIVEAA